MFGEEKVNLKFKFLWGGKGGWMDSYNIFFIFFRIFGGFFKCYLEFFSFFLFY